MLLRRKWCSPAGTTRKILSAKGNQQSPLSAGYLMVWGIEDSTVLGLAGIIAGALTAGISFWWNYKTRALPHREFLYQEQIKAYADLSAAIIRSIQPCYDFLSSLSSRELTSNELKRLENLMHKAGEAIWKESAKSIAILPSEVALAINDLVNKLITELPKSDNTIQMAKSLLDMLGKLEGCIFIAVRKWAGVDPLTKEMLRVFGQR